MDAGGEYQGLQSGEERAVNGMSCICKEPRRIVAYFVMASKQPFYVDFFYQRRIQVEPIPTFYRRCTSRVRPRAVLGILEQDQCSGS